MDEDSLTHLTGQLFWIYLHPGVDLFDQRQRVEAVLSEVDLLSDAQIDWCFMHLIAAAIEVEGLEDDCPGSEDVIANCDGFWKTWSLPFPRTYRVMAREKAWEALAE